MMTRMIRPLVAVITLVLVAGLLAGAAYSGFYFEHQMRQGLLDRQRQLANVKARTADLAARSARSSSGTGAGVDARKLWLPVTAPGVAGAEMQSRLIAMMARSGGRVESARVLPPEQQGGRVRISVDVVAAIKTKPLRNLLVALESDTPLSFVERLDVRRIASGPAKRKQSTAQQSPSLTVSMRVSSYMASTGKKDQVQ